MSKSRARILVNIILIQIGAVLVSLGLEEFLIPNHLLDGGIVGVAIIVNFLSGLPLGPVLLAINLPFVIVGMRKLGPRFVLLTFYALGSLSLWVSFFHPIPAITQDVLLSAIFGGFFVGIGVGLIIRNGGCLDGTEIVAILASKKLAFSVGEIVMFFNVFIFTGAGFVFGIDRALYSIVGYLVAYKTIDVVLAGINQSHSFFIVTSKPAELSDALMAKFGSGVTILKGMGGFSRSETDILYFVVGRLEMNKAKALIREIDDEAFITIQYVHEQIKKERHQT